MTFFWKTGKNRWLPGCLSQFIVDVPGVVHSLGQPQQVHAGTERHTLEICGLVTENVGLCWVNFPNEIAIFHRDNDQQNHWVQWGTQHFQTHPCGFFLWSPLEACCRCLLHHLRFKDLQSVMCLDSTICPPVILPVIFHVIFHQFHQQKHIHIHIMVHQSQ